MKLPLHLLLPTIKGVPVLMYHKVWNDVNDRLTISPDQLRTHFQYLKQNGYRSLGLGEFISIAKGKQAFEPKTFLLTFDDGYVNNLTLAYPILKEFEFKATFFIIGNAIVTSALPEEEEVNLKMTIEQLKMLHPDIVQLALHSQNHIHFGHSELSVIKEDLVANIQAFQNAQLTFYKVLAYPYGGRPKDKNIKLDLQNWMQNQGLEAAFRIGNKPCRIPSSQMFELKRIDVWGTDSVSDLAIKMKKGKLKPF